MNYTNREVVKRLKQYDMFINSLNITEDENTRERICDQLDRIEKQILLETNTEYEEEYMYVLGEKATSFEEEKTRLRKLINIIEERRKYLETRKNNHKKITGSLVELTTFLGEDKLTIFRRRLDIIETYEKNVKEQEKLINEMKSLDIKISETSRNVKANARLDDILENKMVEIINKAFEKLNLFELSSDEKDIEEKYATLKFALEMAKDNLKSAKDINDTYMILECDNILSEITLEYNKYHEQIHILKLMEIYEKKTEDYNSLLEKRESIDEILKEIPESELYKEVNEELTKELNTIRLQKQDIDNNESLKKERLISRERMVALEEENNSKEFKIVLDELVKNENRIREEQIKLAKKKEYEEKQERLLEEQKLEASRRRRQKLIEEARMKEQQERINKVKELQENTVIGNKKEDNLFEGKTIDDFLLPKEKIDTTLPEEKSILEEITEEASNDNELQIDNEKTKDLFTENFEPIDLSINFDNINTEDEKEEAKGSFNFNLDDFDDIPVIENNNLKPELVEDKTDFPKINDKEGEILWKETL